MFEKILTLTRDVFDLLRNLDATQRSVKIDTNEGDEMKAIDLFSGPGGLSIGLKRARIEIKACVENNKDAIETYMNHDSKAEHINKDIREICFEHYRGKIDIVVGGPPCQPFSVGGLRKGKSDKRDMIPEFIRCLDQIKPEAFIMENVPGLTFRKALPYFNSVLQKLKSSGFLLNWAILNSADYGIPQKRKRLIVLGARNSHLRFPAPSRGPAGNLPYVKALDVLGNEPIGESPNCPVKYAKYPDLRPSPYAGHLYNGGGRPIDPEGPCHTILASSGGYKTHWIDTEGVAPQYHTHLCSGGEPWEGEVKGARRLSVEECAILQTFPRDMVFLGKRSSQYRQVGDAVPPDLAHVIGTAVLSQLSNNHKNSDLMPQIRDIDAYQREFRI